MLIGGKSFNHKKQNSKTVFINQDVKYANYILKSGK